GDIVVDVMRTHPMTIIGGILQENSSFVPPDELLLELKDRRRTCSATSRPQSTSTQRSNREMEQRTAQEISSLRRCNNDLASLLAMPAMWTGQHCSQVISTLLTVLVHMLGLDLAYARATDPEGKAPQEWLRTADNAVQEAKTGEVGRALEPYLATELPTTNFR